MENWRPSISFCCLISPSNIHTWNRSVIFSYNICLLFLRQYSFFSPENMHIFGVRSCEIFHLQWGEVQTIKVFICNPLIRFWKGITLRQRLLTPGLKLKTLDISDFRTPRCETLLIGPLQSLSKVERSAFINLIIGCSLPKACH